ncbi:MAG: zf-TFIIB domain-containing protein [Planctomycetes bacterium]|nr:zf-TFIIB domain-containing protein [Planctomycetota bacterium]
MLVICEDCERNYDASGRELGSRFHCHCGAIVTVAEAKEKRGHNAQVVRCSSCGGPRHDQATSCQYCQADFTLHERDLKAVCPKCLARVSSSASFCHACGHTMQSESCAALATDAGCPSCGDGKKLQSREFSPGKSFLECGNCAGMWVGNSVIQSILKTAKSEGRDASFGLGQQPAIATRSVDNRPEGDPLYRECPECRHHMRRHIFAQNSGVVIDSCKEHGVWFDAQELDLILDWVRGGGQGASERPQSRVSATLPANNDYSDPVKISQAGQSVASTAVDVLSETIGVFGSLFFRKF